MKPWEVLDETATPDGGVMRLVRHDEEYIIQVDGRTLMSSRMHGSEEALAAAGCRHLQDAAEARVLVGGLGMGFTLAATLAALPSMATVIVAELVPAVVEWNRGPLGACAGHPLNDRRVRVAVNDVGFVIRANPGRFDAILLDVDNGPAAFTTVVNQGLYEDAGVATTFAALTDGGVFAVWSAWEDGEFEQRLRAHGFAATSERVRARAVRRGARHTVVLGIKPPRR